MLFAVVRHTWGPETIPGDRRRRVSPLCTETVAYGETRQDAERLAQAHACECPAKGYNAAHGYWWGRDHEFRYTFRVEVRSPSMTLSLHPETTVRRPLQQVWSEGETEQLRELAGTMPVRHIASRLSRSQQAVQSRADKLGISLKPPKGATDR